MFKHLLLLGLLITLIGGLLLTWASVDSTKAFNPSPPDSVSSHEISQSSPDWPPLNLYEGNDLDQRLTQLNNKSEAALIQEQQARLQADISTLAMNDTDTNDAVLKTKLYGENWQQEVHRYKQRSELREFVVTTSIVLTVLGAVISIGCICLLVDRLFIRIFKSLFGKQKEQDLDTDELAENPVLSSPLDTGFDIPVDPLLPEQREHIKQERNHFGSRSRVTVNYETSPINAYSDNNNALEYQRIYPQFDDFYFNDCHSHEALAGLLCDEESLPLSQRQSIDTPVLQDEDVDTDTKTGLESAVSVCTEPDAADTDVKNADVEAPDLDDTITSQTEDLAKQIAEVQEMAQHTSQTSEDTEGPINETLHQLSEQISAIRQYAASQQDRVEKLQSGYDWNIIRTFCLRFIRCIDNLEMRIARLEQEDTETDCLRDVRDELLFALESSGVEQYEPEPGSLFRGQERTAEAVKDKEPCSNPDLHGHIAAVMKPGYQYLIDDENVKIVRTARVKLYE